MISVRKFAGLQITFWFCLLIAAAFPQASHGQAQTDSVRKGEPLRSAKAVEAGDRTFPALLVSDIHFDPFHDPAKVQQLVDAPVSQWSLILSAPPSPTQRQDFATLQQSCHARGVDTPYALLNSSLQAMWSQQPDAKFMTVSGDLLAHSFSCRYMAVLPGSKPGEYEAFVVKTLSFVMGELRARFPGRAVYVALGNNDSACGDYRLDTGSDFLAQTARIVAEGLPRSQQAQALKEFAKGGYYSVLMEAPMQGTRLIVINDVFLSPNYSNCAGKPDPAATDAEMTWLKEELAQARRLGQRVWVMGHIPPGVDPYSTVARFRDVCGGEAPVLFLSSDKLADMLIEYGDVIRLGIFGHSHMDEIRLLEAQSGPQSSSGHGTAMKSVAIKMVPSISPVDGNNPAFTIARVGIFSALLRDYEVIAASNQSGVATVWSREYDYAQSYHEAEFSALAARKLIAEFEDDRGAKTAASQEYIRNYFVGDLGSELQPFWPLYVCTMGNYTAKGFAACVCSAGK